MYFIYFNVLLCGLQRVFVAKNYKWVQISRYPIEIIINSLYISHFTFLTNFIISMCFAIDWEWLMSFPFNVMSAMHLHITITKTSVQFLILVQWRHISSESAVSHMLCYIESVFPMGIYCVNDLGTNLLFILTNMTSVWQETWNWCNKCVNCANVQNGSSSSFWCQSPCPVKSFH